MANDYYAASFASAHTLARAADVLAQLQAIETGLELLPTKIRLRTGTVMWCDDDTGVADAYVITTPVTTSVTYIDGLFVRFRAKNANTGPSTLNVNGLGNKAIRRYDGSALTLGDITDEQIVDGVYDADRGYFVMVGVVGGIAVAAATSATAAATSASAAASSASAAAGSAAAASASQTAAAASAAAAAVSAAAVNLPSSMVGKTLNMLRVKADESGHEYRTPAEIRADLDLEVGTDFLSPASIAATYLTSALAASTYLTSVAAAAAYQPLGGDLTAFAGLSHTAGEIVIDNGSAWAKGAYPINRNLLLNGEMKVAQRGVSPATAVNTDTYTLDQWTTAQSGGGTLTVVQDTTVPNAQFVNSLKITVPTADSSIGATDHYAIAQYVEGLRCSRVGFGGASAQSLTFSFWVRVDSSDLTFPATFSGSIANSARNRSYPFSFSVAASATWQKITVAISGDTTGTWLQTSGVGLRLYLALAMGSNRTGTAGAWSASDLRAATGQVNFMNHTSNVMYLTGVQLEVGSVATPFEYRDYGEELRLCKRCFRRYTGAEDLGYVYYYGTAVGRFFTLFEVEMRAAPTATVTASDLTLTYGATSTVACNSFGSANNGASTFGYMAAVGVGTTPFTAGQVGSIELGSTKNLDFSAEL